MWAELRRGRGCDVGGAQGAGPRPEAEARARSPDPLRRPGAGVTRRDSLHEGSGEKAQARDGGGPRATEENAARNGGAGSGAAPAARRPRPRQSRSQHVAGSPHRRRAAARGTCGEAGQAGVRPAGAG